MRATTPTHAVRRPKQVVRRGAQRTVGRDSRAMSRVDAYRMIRRRVLQAGRPVLSGCHTLHATATTADLGAGEGVMKRE
jgi:hypothetical protein